MDMVFYCRQLNALVREERMEITSCMNGVPLFPPKKKSFSCIEMNGKEVFRFAVRCVPQSIEAALDEAGIPTSSIDWLLLHQVSIWTPSMFSPYTSYLPVVNNPLLGKSADHRCCFHPFRHTFWQNHIEFGKLWEHQRRLHSVGIGWGCSERKGSGWEYHCYGRFWCRADLGFSNCEVEMKLPC